MHENLYIIQNIIDVKNSKSSIAELISLLVTKSNDIRVQPNWNCIHVQVCMQL